MSDSTTSLTAQQLLALTRPTDSTLPPPGFVAVPSDKLVVPGSADARIDYKAFFNAATNELVITGTPKPQPMGASGMPGEDVSNLPDMGIFFDSNRVRTGSNAGAFIDKPLPAAQTEALVAQLTDPQRGPYAGATVTLVGEGSVGLAMSVASYDLRSAPSAAVQMGTTVTFNAWTGRWTSDGSSDTGVVDVRSPAPMSADVGWAFGWKPGGTVASVGGINAQVVGAGADAATQAVVSGVDWLAAKGTGALLSEGMGWVAEKVLGKLADAAKEPSVDLATSVVASIDGPVAAAKLLGWQTNLSAADLARVLQGDISEGQWNVIQGKTSSGYPLDGTFYEPSGNAVSVVGPDGTSHQQPAVQVTTFKDPASGANMEVRTAGTLIDGEFVATPGTTIALGLDTAGRLVMTGPMALSLTQGLMPTSGYLWFSGSVPFGDSVSLSVQNIGGVANYEVTGTNGSKAWILPDGSGGRVLVVSKGQDIPGQPATLVMNLDAAGNIVGTPKNYDTQGREVGTSGELLSAASTGPQLLAAFFGNPLSGGQVETMREDVHLADADTGAGTMTDAGWIPFNQNSLMGGIAPATEADNGGQTVQTTDVGGGSTFTAIRDGEGRVVQVNEATTLSDGTRTIVSFDGQNNLLGTSLVDADGKLRQVTLIDSNANSATTKVYDDSQLVSTTTNQTYADGTTSVIVSYSSGRRTTITTDLDNNSRQVDYTVPSDPNVQTITLRDKTGAVTSVKTITPAADDSGAVIPNTYATVTTDGGGGITFTGTVQVDPVDGSRTDTELSAATPSKPNGTLQVTTVDSTGSQLVASASALANVGTAISSLQDAYALVRAVQNHQALPTLGSGLHLANDLTQGSVPALSEASGAVNALSSLVGLNSALKSGDTAGIIVSGAGLIDSAASVYAQSIGYESLQEAVAWHAFGDEASSALGALSDAMPYAAAFYDLVNGNVSGAVADAAGAYVGAAFAAEEGAELGSAAGPIGAVVGLVVGYVLGSLFGDDPPPPWGSATFTWGSVSGQLSVNLLGDDSGQGKQAAGSALQEAGNGVADLVTAFDAANPNAQLGLIANRMGSISYGSAGVLGLTLHVSTADLATGQDPYPTLQFSSAAPHTALNASTTDAVYFQTLDQFYLQNALAREAIAPMWEVRTAQLQTQNNLSNAGLSEVERAANQGQLAAAPAPGATTEDFNPIGLDLGGGLATTALANSGVQFDVSGQANLNAEVLGQSVTHYLNRTAWLNSQDGFLVLDKNVNGTIDDGEEMFSNSLVSEQARGIASLQTVDADGNGQIDASDPVYNQLLVWRDANGDGRVEAGEASSLSSLGITSLNYKLGTFTESGQTRQMSTLTLQASTSGNSYTPVDGGIKITNTNGQTSIAVTQVNDLSSLQANEDGISTEENTPVTVIAHGANGVQGLLDNDHVSNAPNALLSLTGVSNAQHGTVSFDAASQSVTFTPDAGYSGNDAGFDYTVSGGVYGQAVAHVQVDVAHVDAAPHITGEQNTQIPIYGYSITTTGGGDSSDPVTTVTPLYQPGYGYAGQTADGSFAYRDQPVTYQTDPYSGTISVTDADDPASALTWSVVGQPHNGNVSVDANGHWTFNNAQAVGGNDAFIVQVKDPSGKTDQIQVTVPLPSVVSGPPQDTGGDDDSDDGDDDGDSPVVVDVNGTGFHFGSVNDSNVFFEQASDGWRHRTAWFGGGNGVLAFDKYGDGIVHDSSQISFKGFSASAQTDLQGLAAFDSNHDGVIDKLDARWGDLGVWVDANQDGISEAGEYQSLDALGIASLSLTSNNQFSVNQGVTVHGISSFTRTDATTGQTADVTLPHSSDIQLTNADGTTTITQLADGGASNPVVVGDGNNLVLGNAGDNLIQVGNGNNVVITGAGNDMIATGNGDNTIQTGDGKDVVTLGNGNNTVFLGAGPKLVIAGNGNNLIVGGSGSAEILGGGGNDVIYAGTGNSLLYGGKGDDTLVGGEGHNGLIGGAGNDTLQDGGGRADMAGGTGDDTYVVTNAADTIAENANEGTDTVKASIDYALGANLENLTLTGHAALTGTGNELDNVLIGNGAADILVGGAGNDALADSGGAATLIGGTGDDIYVVSNAATTVLENAGEGHDTIRTSVNYTLPANVEVLQGTGNAAITLTGGSQDGVTLIANNANDTLVAGSGAATLVGGTGNDTFVINSAADVVEAQAAGNTNTVISSVSYTAPANVQVLRASGNAAITLAGNNLGDTLTANDAGDTLIGGLGADLLFGGSGNDTLQDGGPGTAADAMSGGAGDDSYVVNNSADQVTEAASGGLDTVYTSVDYVLPANVERLIGTGTAALRLIGGTQAGAIIIANSGDDTLVAGSAAVTLVGGTGNDTFVINSADDVVFAQAGGINTVQTSVSYTAGQNVVRVVGTGTDALTLTANDGDDTLVAGDGVATLIGGKGNDTFVINRTDDVVIAKAGGVNTVQTSVSYTAGENIQRVVGTGSAALTLTANNGDDTLVAGDGIATLIGGTGNDTFVINKTADVVVAQAGGVNTVQTSVSYTAGDHIQNIVGLGSADLTLTGNSLANTIAANAGNDTLVAGSGPATLIGGSGNDTFVINSDADVVIAQAGGVNTVYTSVSYTAGAHVQNVIGTGWASLTLTGNDLTNTLTANDANDTLVAGTGNATLIGGSGSDTFIVNNRADTIRLGSGNSTVSGGDADVTLIAGSAGFAAVTLGNGNSSLDFSANNNGQTIKLGFGSNVVSLGDGSSLVMLDQGTAPTGQQVPSHDVLTLGTGTDTVLGGNSNVTLTAGSPAGYGTDYVTLGNGDDTLTLGRGTHFVQLGDGNDSLTTANGYNSVTMGNGNDRLQLADGGASITLGDGDDTVVAGDGYLWLTAGNGADSISVGTGGGNFRLGNGNDTLTTVGGYSSVLAGDGADQIKLAANGSVTLGNGNDSVTVGDGGSNITLGSGNDHVVAGNGYNSVTAGDGADSVRVGSGGSSIRLGNGSDSVVAGDGYNSVTGGGGHDDVTVGNGGSSIQLGNGDDTVIAGNGYNYVAVGNGHDSVRVGDGGSNVQLGDGNDTVVVGNGYNTIHAGNGNDTVTLGDGGNSLTLGSGTDRVVLGNGSATIQLDGGTDTIVAGNRAGNAADSGHATLLAPSSGTSNNTELLFSNATSDQLWFERSGNDLEIGVIGTSFQFDVSNWYGSSANHLQEIVAADGKVLLDTQVDALVNAMAAFSPPASGTTVLPDNYQAQLHPVIAANWH